MRLHVHPSRLALATAFIEPMMLRLPDDMAADPAVPTRVLHGATVAAFTTSESGSTREVLVTRPTLVFVRTGTKEIRTHATDLSLAVPAGGLLTLRSGTHTMSERVPEHGAFESTIVSFEPDFLRTTIGAAPATADSPAAVATSTSIAVAHRLEALCRGLDRSDEHEAEHLLRLRQLLLAVSDHEATLHLLRREAFDAGAGTNDRLRSIMAEHCLSPLDVAAYAAMCAMSLSTFKRHFREVYGASPGRWLTDVRLRHAESMLRLGDRSITEICHASGYRDTTSFARAFRRHHGVSPSEYRRATTTAAPPTHAVVALAPQPAAG